MYVKIVYVFEYVCIITPEIDFSMTGSFAKGVFLSLLCKLVCTVFV